MEAVVPSRISEAREARALSMESFADSIGVTRQSVSKYERGIMTPSPEVIQNMSYKLNIPMDFFYKAEATVNAVGSPLFFRSNSGIAKKVKTACKYQIKWVDEIKRQLERYVDFVAHEVPTIDTDYRDISPEDVEELALEVRRLWHIGDDPIKDLIGLLENKGIIVSQFAMTDSCDFKGIDAFSEWKNGTPYVLYHPIPKSAVRSRFSILHELGHLILHNAISGEDSIKKDVIDFADSQADRFAAAFLLPATSFPNDIRGTSLVVIENVKRKWGAAMSTIIKRCETLEILSESQLNYIKRQMSTKKYWYKEPLDDTLNIMGPEILRDAILLLVDSNIVTRDSFVRSVALSKEDLKCLCALPNDFFSNIHTRQMPALKIISG